MGYLLDLLEELSHIHSTFHVSQLQKCLVDDAAVVSLDNIQVDQRLNYVESPVATLHRKMKALHNKVVPLVKV